MEEERSVGAPCAAGNPFDSPKAPAKAWVAADSEGDTEMWQGAETPTAPREKDPPREETTADDANYSLAGTEADLATVSFDRQERSRPSKTDDEKNKQPPPPPPPPPRPSQRRLFRFARPRDPEVNEIAARIKQRCGKGISNAASQTPPERIIRSDEGIRDRPELLRKMALCFSGCLTPKPTATPHDDEHYAPLFQSTNAEQNVVEETALAANNNPPETNAPNL